MKSELEKLRDLTKNIKMVMFSTLAEDGTIHSRPMGAQEIDQDGNAWFFTSTETGKVASIARNPEVNLAYVAESSGVYVSATGVAELVNDRNKAQELWNPMLSAWFPQGINQPDLVLIKVKIKSAEYWDAPQGKMIQILGIAKAALTGVPYPTKQGEHGRLGPNLTH
jgi:general stress protein 26